MRAREGGGSATHMMFISVVGGGRNYGLQSWTKSGFSAASLRGQAYNQFI